MYFYTREKKRAKFLLQPGIGVAKILNDLIDSLRALLFSYIYCDVFNVSNRFCSTVRMCNPVYYR